MKITSVSDFFIAKDYAHRASFFLLRVQSNFCLFGKRLKSFSFTTVSSLLLAPHNTSIHPPPLTLAFTCES